MSKATQVQPLIRSPRGVYAITRLKAARNAWYWAVHFRRRGQTHYRRFYDLKHGGEKKALAAAITWRDRNLATAKILTYREFHAQRRSNNTSGVVGVHLVKSARQPSGAWQAKIKLPDGRKITKSSVLKFGRKEAFERAVAARAEMLALIHSVCEVLRDHVALESECIDRMSLNVYVPQLQRVGGVVWYLRGHLGQRFASTAAVEPKTDAFVRSIERFVADAEVPSQ